VPLPFHYILRSRTADDWHKTFCDWCNQVCREQFAYIPLLSRTIHGCITCNITASDLIEKSDLDVFKKISYPGHSLNHLLPPKRVSHNLPERGHIFDLPAFNTALHKNSYLVAMFYINTSNILYGAITFFIHLLHLRFYVFTFYV